MRRASRSPALLKTKKCGLRTSIQPTLGSLAAKPAPHSKSAMIALLHQLCHAPLVIESACKPVRRAVSRLRPFSPPADLKRVAELTSSRPNRFSILILARVSCAAFLECGRLVDPDLRRAAAFSLVAM